MKWFVYFAFMLFMYFPCQAQFYGEEESTAERTASRLQSKLEHAKWKEKKIRSQKIFWTDRKGKPYLGGVYKYTAIGNPESYTRFNNKGDTVYFSLYEFNDSNDMVSRAVKIKKHLNKVIYVYDSAYQLVELITSKDNKITWREIYRYDRAGNQVEATFYRTSKQKLSSRYEYDYYEDGKKKEARFFNNRNKLGSVRTYECGEIGKTAKELAKDSAKVCIRYEFDSLGNKIKVVEEFDRKGKRIALTEVTDTAGNIIHKIATWPGGKISLKMDCTYYPGTDLMKELQYFSRWGGKKIKVHYEYIYDQEQSLAKIIQKKKGKKTEVISYEYEKF